MANEIKEALSIIGGAMVDFLVIVCILGCLYFLVGCSGAPESSIGGPGPQVSNEVPFVLTILGKYTLYNADNGQRIEEVYNYESNYGGDTIWIEVPDRVVTTHTPMAGSTEPYDTLDIDRTAIYKTGTHGWMRFDLWRD